MSIIDKESSLGKIYPNRIFPVPLPYWNCFKFRLRTGVSTLEKSPLSYPQNVVGESAQQRLLSQPIFKKHQGLGYTR
jgi:hypothetical protein